MPIGQKLLNLREYHRPDKAAGLAHVLALLARPDIHTVVLGGGDTLLGSGDLSIEAVVDLQALGLDALTIEQDGAALRAGAMVTRTALTQIEDADPGRPLYLIAAGARRWGGNVQRNRATVGGALATAAANDPLLVALLACDAAVALETQGGPQALPLAEFLAKRVQILAQPGLITGVTVPQPPPGAAGYALADVARTPADAPIVVAAASLAVAAGRCTQARVAVGGVADQPVRMPAVEAILEGQALTVELIAAAGTRVSESVQPAGDFRGSSEYRAAMAGVLAERVLQQAWQTIQMA